MRPSWVTIPISMTVSTPRLSEAARHLVIPDGIVRTNWPVVQRRLKTVGIEFDPWQQGVASIALGCRKDGKYAATVGGVTMSVPRQVGKTFSIGNLIIGLCLEFPRLKAVWTSHHGRTTANTFQSMQGMVRRKAIAPLLAPDRSNGVRTTNGEQEIRFRNGSVIMFGAREHGFGRGMDGIDALVFDEAQMLGLKALEDMVPATNQARHKHGALVFFMGTPPRPVDDGEVFTSKRERALSGESKNLAYIEFSADEDAPSGKLDFDQVAKANPSFPHRTPVEAVQRMFELIPDEESWVREALGVWPKVSRHQVVVASARWHELKIPDLESGGKELGEPACLAMDMSHGLDISVAAGWTLDEHRRHVEEVWRGNSAPAVADWIADRAGRRIPILVDGMSPASSLVPELRARGAKVRITTAADMARACLLFEQGVTAGWLSHCGQDSVTEALMGARKRPIRDAGGWGWDRRDAESSIYPIVAATLALYGAAGANSSPSKGRMVVMR